MANILITNRCNRKCPFCFARLRVNIKGKVSPDYMSRDDVRKVMDFMERSDDPQLRLLGGEPTLHPDFIDIVTEALARDFHVHIFTNGIMSKKTADFLSDIPKEKLSLLCNVSHDEIDTENHRKRKNYALKKLAEKAQVGMTITSPDFEYQYLIDLINAFGLRRHVRVGIAQPIVGCDNAYLEGHQYREAGKRIVKMARSCIKEEILIGFDCGMTLCMFDEAEIGFLMKNTEGFVMRCDPIIDVGTDLDVWNCFPLSNVLVSHLDQYETRNKANKTYKKVIAPYRVLGCRPECFTCIHLKRKQCTGGCLAHAMNSLNKLPPVEVDPEAHECK